MMDLWATLYQSYHEDIQLKWPLKCRSLWRWKAGKRYPIETILAVQISRWSILMINNITVNMMNDRGDAHSVRLFTLKIKHEADITSPSSANIISDKFYQEGRIHKHAGSRKAVERFDWLVIMSLCFAVLDTAWPLNLRSNMNPKTSSLHTFTATRERLKLTSAWWRVASVPRDG